MKEGVMETIMPEGDQLPDPDRPEDVPPRDPETEELPDEDGEGGDVVDRAQEDLAGKLGAIGSGPSGR
jgi:hypothetical protein